MTGIRTIFAVSTAFSFQILHPCTHSSRSKAVRMSGAQTQAQLFSLRDKQLNDFTLCSLLLFTLFFFLLFFLEKGKGQDTKNPQCLDADVRSGHMGIFHSVNLGLL